MAFVLLNVLILAYLFYPMFIVGLLERKDRISVINKLVLIELDFIIHFMGFKIYLYSNHN